MIGKAIKIIRQRKKISQVELAHNSGLSVEELDHIERNVIDSLDGRKLMKIADNLHLKSAYDFGNFMRLNKKNPRKFQAYTVGLPKTGTVSLIGIFENYHTHHEYDQWGTHQTVVKYRHGKISREQFSDFIIDRDLLAGCPEMDSAHFNRHYMDILAEEFPDAKFICLIRDCYSWLNSFINYFYYPAREAVQSSKLPNGMPFDLPRGESYWKDELVDNFHKYIDTPLSFWTAEYRSMLDKLPPGRSMVIRTHEIADRIPEIARLVDAPPDSLIKEKSHLNRVEYRVSVLHRLDYGFLEAKFNEHCSDLMDEFFPGRSLRDFFATTPITPEEPVNL